MIINLLGVAVRKRNEAYQLRGARCAVSSHAEQLGSDATKQSLSALGSYFASYLLQKQAKPGCWQSDYFTSLASEFGS